MTTEVERPSPVVDVAASETLAGRIVAAVSLVLAALPAFLLEFDVISWDGGQVASYQVFIGVLVSAALLLLAKRTKDNALAVQAVVTPVQDPMSNEGTPLVPIADDGFEETAD